MGNVTIPRADLTGQAAYVREAFDDLKAATDAPPASAVIVRAKVAELGSRLARLAQIGAIADDNADISVYAGTGCTPKTYND